MTAETVLMAGGMGVAAVVWLVRLEGRINLADSKYDDVKDDIAEIKSDVKALLKK